jgi:hypothetical protein
LVELKELEKSFEEFRNYFCDIVYDFNKGAANLSIDNIQDKVRQSEFYKKLKQYLKERGWKIVEESFDIEVEKNGKVEEIPVMLNIEDENVKDEKLIIEGWNNVWRMLHHLGIG